MLITPRELLFRSIAPAFLLPIISQPLFAQAKDSTAKVTWSAYVDAYYAYYTDSVGDGNFQKFPSVAPRSDQFGLNTAMVTAQYDAKKVRGIVSLHYGDIARSAWSATQNAIMEAHVGLRLCETLWIDAGYFRTHFGTEGLLPKENIASSISVNTWHEPYFESGVRFNYVPSDKFTINLYVLNGYNLFEDNNRKKSVGLLATYAFSDSVNLNYSNYLGDDTPTAGDSISHMRIHQNVYLNWAKKKWKLQVGGDFCMQENSSLTDAKESATMFSGVASVKRLLGKMYAGYVRGEVFSDPDGFMGGVIVNTKGEATGLKIWGATGGIEYRATDNAYVRLEFRQLIADQDQEIFIWDKHITNGRSELLLHMGVSF